MPTATMLNVDEKGVTHDVGALVTMARHDTLRALGASEGAAQTFLQAAYPSFNHAGEMAAQELANHTHASIGRITDVERLLDGDKASSADVQAWSTGSPRTRKTARRLAGLHWRSLFVC